jgi:ATP-dependent RNA helicase DDX1
VRFFVLDEADALADQGFGPLMKVYENLPKVKELQVLMFSATLHTDKIKELASKLCRFPTWVDLKGKDATPETVDHAYISVDPNAQQKLMEGATRIQTDGIHWNGTKICFSPSDSFRQNQGCRTRSYFGSYQSAQTNSTC